MNFLEFDDYLLSTIFDFCIKETSFVLLLTCKRFNNVINEFSPLLDSYISHLSYPYKFLSVNMKKNYLGVCVWFLQQCGNVTKFDIFMNFFIENESLKLRMNVTFWLEIIKISPNVIFFEDCLRILNYAIVEKYDRLRELVIAFTKNLQDFDFCAYQAQFVKSCISSANFDLLESTFANPYDKLQLKDWEEFVNLTIDNYHKDPGCLEKISKIRKKYEIIYHGCKFYPDIINSSLKSNNIGLFLWAMKSAETNENSHTIAEKIIQSLSKKFYVFIFEELVFLHEDLWYNSNLYQDEELFKFFIKNKNRMSHPSDDSIWKYVIKYGSDKIVARSLKYLDPLISFDDEVSTVAGAKALIQMKTKVTTWNQTNNIDLICWLIDKKMVQFSDFDLQNLWMVCLKSKTRRKLLRLWIKFDEKSLIEHCFDFVDVQQIVELTYQVKKHFIQFLDQCFDEMNHLPEQSIIDDKMESFIYFAYMINSPSIFRVLMKYGYKLNKSAILDGFREHYHVFGMVSWVNKIIK